jgi:transposase
MDHEGSPVPPAASGKATPAAAASTLPSNVEACHALIAALSSSVSELHGAKVQLSQEIEALKLTVTRLMLQLQGHRRERHADDPNQTRLDWGDDGQAEDALKEAAEEAEVILQEYTVKRKLKPKKPRNEKLPEHLPRVEVRVPVSEEVSHCPEHGLRQQIGEDRLETLKLTPPKLWVEVRIIPKFACAGEPQCGVKEPERPLGLVEGNRYDTSVAAHIVADKFAYHMPTYRQQDRFASSGWTPSRSTLLNLINASSFVLEPLAEHYRRLALTDGVLGTDDTTLTLLLPPEIPAVKESDPLSSGELEPASGGRNSSSRGYWG